MVHCEDFTSLTFDCYGTLIDWERCAPKNAQC